MTMIRFTPHFLLGSLLAVLGSGIEESHAADLKFRVQLVWGTNDDKSKEPPKADIVEKFTFGDEELKDSDNKDKPKEGSKEAPKTVEPSKQSSEKIKEAGGAAKPAPAASSTDPKKPADDKGQRLPLKEVDPQLAQSLRKIFKWTRYYEVFRKEQVTVGNAAVKVKPSNKCEIELKSIGKPMLEVKLFGEGKLVKTVKQPAPPGEYLVIAGDDKNDTAWFVVISPQ